MKTITQRLHKLTKGKDMKHVSLALLCALALGLTTHLQARVFNDDYAYADERPYRNGVVGNAVRGSADVAEGAVDTASHAVSDTLHTIF